MFVVFRRPLMVLNRMSSPSRLTKITDVCACPSCVDGGKDGEVIAVEDVAHRVVEYWVVQLGHARVDSPDDAGESR